MFNRNRLSISVALALLSGVAGAANADTDKIQFDIEKQGVGSAMIKLGELTGVQIAVPYNVGNKLESVSIKGEYTLEEALEKILSGSGLTYQFTSESSVVITEAEKEEKENSENNTGSKDVDEEIIVTGSRIITDPGKLDRKINVYTREEIEATSATTLAEFMRDLPQNFDAPTENGAGFSGTFGSAPNFFAAAGVNLRGLGERATLVLIDGRRAARGGVLGDAVDLTQIPLSQVDRIEVIFDGASSIYGADAAGGVVNIITRKDYEGVEVNLTHVEPGDNGGAQTTFSVGGTFAWETGSLTANYQYFKQQDVQADQRGVRFRTPTFDQVPAGSPGNVSAIEVFDLDTFEFVVNPLFSLDADGNPVDPNDPSAVTPVFQTQLPLGGVPTLADFAGQEVTPGSLAEAGLSLIPGREQHSVRFGLRQALTDDIQLGVDLSYTPGETASFEENQVISIFQVAPYDPVLDFGHPDSPFFTQASIITEVPGLPDTERYTDKKDIGFGFTLDGTFLNEWRWALDGTYSISDNKGERRNVIKPGFGGLLANPLGTAFVNGEEVPASEVLQGLNLFTSPLFGAESVEQLAEIILDPIALTENKSEETGFEFTIQGALLSLPGGDVHTLVGIGTRDEESELFDDSSTVGNRVSPNALSGSFLGGRTYNQSLKRSTDFAKLEMNIPIIGDNNSLPGINGLDVTLSARYSEITSFGTEEVVLREDPSTGEAIESEFNALALKDSGTAWSTGLVWRPVEWLAIRANTSTAFSAPPIASYVLEARLSPVSETFALDGSRPPIRFLTGGNPDLVPEDNTTTRVGFRLTPDFIPNFVLDVDFNSNELTNRISEVPGDNFETAADVSDTRRLDITIGPDGIPIQDRRQYNLGTTVTKGIDMDVSYSQIESPIGVFNVNLSYAYLGRSDWTRIEGGCEVGCFDDNVGLPINRVERVALLPPGEFDSPLGATAPFTPIPQHRATVRLGWENGGWRVDLSTAYSSDVTKEVVQFNRETFESFLQEQITKSANPIDVVINYDFDKAASSPEWLRGTRIGLSLPNVFDAQTDYLVSPSESGMEFQGVFNPIFSRPRGRAYTLTVRKMLEL